MKKGGSRRKDNKLQLAHRRGLAFVVVVTKQIPEAGPKHAAFLTHTSLVLFAKVAFELVTKQTWPSFDAAPMMGGEFIEPEQWQSHELAHLALSS